MNKYLITGGGGFIGTNLIDYIIKNDPNSKIRVVTNVEPQYRIIGCDYVICSVGETEKYADYLDGYTSVIHLAWNGFPNIKIKDVFEGISSNIIQSCLLFNKAIKNCCKTIVFLSSGGGIYGKPLTVPIKETHPTVPLSYYGVEKLSVENYLRLMTNSSETKGVVLRPSNPYGRYQRPFIGQGVIATFLASALLEKPVEVWGDGSAVRDYYYIDDLSSAIVKASEKATEFTIANIGSGIGTSINDIIKTIEKVSKKGLIVNYKESTSAETGANILDCTVAKKQFGWKPKYDLEEGIKKMLSTWSFATGQFNERNE